MEITKKEGKEMGIPRAFCSILLAVILVGGAAGCPGNGAPPDREPDIFLHSVPASNTTVDLSGRAENVAFQDFAVAVFIFVEGGWWTKPTFAEPLTPIAADGSWTTDITTGGADATATKIAAFLVPTGYTPPLLSGTPGLPGPLMDEAVAQEAVERGAEGLTRILFFSGYEWWVKSSDAPVGPGPNLFSDSHDNVRVDSDGQLHLRITETNGLYRCAEIVSRDSFGLGRYDFVLDSRVDDINENAILGLFTWSDDPAYHYREMDIEFSRWSDPVALNAQYVAQPWDTPGNVERFSIRPGDVPSAHGFHWQSDSITFSSAHGRDASPEDPNLLIHSWLYSGSDIPIPGDEKVRMNLWLMWGNAPTDGQEVEIVVDSFTFAWN